MRESSCRVKRQIRSRGAFYIKPRMEKRQNRTAHLKWAVLFVVVLGTTDTQSSFQ